jgi:hypothetical protein
MLVIGDNLLDPFTVHVFPLASIYTRHRAASNSGPGTVSTAGRCCG